MNYNPPSPRLALPPIDQRVGLGDVVHTAAQPIVWAVKSLHGPDLNKCGGCANRRKKYNKVLPDIRHPFTRTITPLAPATPPTDN